MSERSLDEMWRDAQSRPDAFIAEHLELEAEITRLRAALAAARADALEEAAAICMAMERRMRFGLSIMPLNVADALRAQCGALEMARMRILDLTDSPTAAPAEKTTQGSPEPSLPSTAPSTAATGHSLFDYDYTYRGVRGRPR